MEINWKDGFAIKVRIEDNTVVLSANKAGLLSLAGILNILADDPAGSHIHLDEYNSLEDGSNEIIIERIE